MIISSVKCPWKDSEGKASIKTQTKSIYDYLQATIDEKNAGGLIYNDADFVGAWDSFFDENGQAMSSLAIFAYAQGNQVDVSTYKDPWEYGGDTGLKNLTASVKKLNKHVTKFHSRNGYFILYSTKESRRKILLILTEKKHHC